MTWIWIGLIVVLSLLELASKNFIPVWFALSALASLILTHFVGNYFIELLLFIILGTVLLIVFRDKLMKFINNKNKLKSKKRNKNEK